MSIDLKRLVRQNIWNLKPYSCARTEYSQGNATVFLDANESPYNNPYNRYPDPLQKELKTAIARVKGVAEERTFLGNGSDEAIDLVLRIFCEPRRDNVVAISPTYGMYEVCAHINDVEYRPVRLNDDFSLNANRLLSATDSRTKVIFLCSPNNPTGNCLEREQVERVLERFSGIVVVDEAYSDFSTERPFRKDLRQYPNMVVLNTMSKAWASAAIRLGMAFASEEIIELMNRVKYPYNVSLPTQREAFAMLRKGQQVGIWIGSILSERRSLMEAFSILPLCEKVFPSDANFFLARVNDARKIYDYLIGRGIVVRDRSRVELCHNALRITIGTPDENSTLLGALRQYKG